MGSKALVLGITGGIGSGKSTVAKLLAGEKGLLIDADKLGHEALAQKEILRRVTDEFGTGILNAEGSVNRPALGAIVFQSADRRAALEKIVHPWIRERITGELKRGRTSGQYPVVVLDAPLLIEGGWKEHVDTIIHVDAPWIQRLERVRERGWDEEKLKLRESAQLPLTEKRASADYIVNNSGGFESLCEQVRAIVKELGLNRE
jgi:dephospho-CoA kinase